jgi:hypothetical protein
VRAARLSGAVLASLLLAACSSGESPDEPTGDELVAVAWSPCDGVTAAEVSRIAGEPMVEQAGTTEQPRCVFTPETEGGPAFDVNYLWFDGGLDEALDSMGAASEQLRPVSVPGADAARIAVRERASGVLVSGFVQTEGLVQSVNAVQIAPYDKDAMVTSTTALLAALAREAPQE